MNRQKKIASVLAGVSFIALSVAASPAMSAGTRQGTAPVGTTINGGSFTGNWVLGTEVTSTPGAYDYLEFNGFDVSGDVVIDEDLGNTDPDGWNDTAIEIHNGSTIGGDLIVNSGVGVGANVYVTDGAGIDASTSVAGIYIHDGGQIEGDLVNNGSVTGFARAEAPDNATAMAFGVGSESDDDSSVFNYGNIDATADATAYDSALAIAGGVGQLDGGTDDETAVFYNEGSVSSVASAYSTNEQFDVDGDADVSAVALAFGGGQYIDAVTAVAYVTNVEGGSISARAFASASDTYQTDVNSLALAGAAGIGQITIGEASANGYVHNDGTVESYAEARAYSGEHDATATAVSLGSLQAATAYGSATVDLVNDNSISANARAIATGSGLSDTGVAIAAAIGNAQLAMSLGGDAAASAVNNGEISASAYASANGYTAIANALGNVQVAMGNSADAYFDNSGGIIATATAAAYGTAIATGSQAFSYAVAGGLFQAAIAYEESATATLKNAGTIDVESSAYANSDLAVAEAWGLGVAQIAVTYGTGDATAALTNTSMDSIDVHANAYATGSVAFADAYDFGAAQIAVAGVNGKASALAYNSGRIDAYASAIAHGSTAAIAEADAAGLNQLALGVESDVYLENTGVIEAHANARADAGLYAQAGAQAIGVGQLSNAFMGPPGIVSDALLHNDSLISAVASATATAVIDAEAYATATGAGQAVGGFVANAVVRNHATISAEANAAAFASSDDAYATAAAVGIDQYAFGNVANAIIYNEGTISASADAQATAYDTAEAAAYATGVDQYANANIATAWLQNSATITANALATAYTTDDDATATATAAGVRQDANGSEATATLDNSGSIKAVAVAYATESGQWDAIGSAIATGIDQYVSGSVGTGSVINTSSISAVASGYAYSTDNDAEADGYAYGVAQTFEGSVGSLDFYNAGSVTATANASALAYDNADASAWAMGLDQEGSGLNVTLKATNLGSISAVANAYAYSTNNDAYASAGATAAWQEVDGSVGTIDFYNDGSLSAVAKATVTGNENVQAEAYAWGLDQHAYSGVSTITATNLRTISAEANALAYSTDNDADATATATGVHQYMEGSVAKADFYNAGTISALANANAYGWDDVSATADAFGLRQEAYANSIILTATNVGTISAVANGYAYSTNLDADADADATAADQFLSGAVVSGAFDNQGSLSAVAYATATAWEDGEADATSTGLDQFARDGVSATLTATNSGTIYASAHAKALSVEGDSDNWADAAAEATGADQDAYTFSATASLDFYNEGSILAVADASAAAWGDADGSADATGLYQNAYFGGVGTIVAINHGDISAFANGYAYSTDNDAEADAEADGVDQNAYSFNSGVASVALTNDGNVTADAVAIASAVYGSADASATGIEGVEQDANGGNATANLVNMGDIVALARAEAVSRYSDASASASASGANQDVAGGTVTADLYNEGNITAMAVAYATGQTEVDALAYAHGFDQEGDGNLNTLTATNHGSIKAGAISYASSTSSTAFASAIATGVNQSVFYGEGSISNIDLTNTGDIGALARANADAYTDASASAYAYGVYQFSNSDIATLTGTNTGDIRAFAAADAMSLNGSAYVTATAIGFGQFIYAVDADASLYNEGNISAVSFADANAPDYAEAYASAYGAEQYIGYGQDPAAFGDLAITNHGEISGFADANAVSTDSDARAEAVATGAYQGNTALYGTVMLDNHGDILATAIADADGYDSGLAAAGAFGHFVEVGGPYGFINTPSIDVVNEDGALISAYADANANDEAYALAMGASYSGRATLNGTIVNAGIIQAGAFAEVSAYGTAVASAFGVVEVSEGANNTTLTNTGTIRTYAEGPNANATGIAIASYGLRDTIPALSAPSDGPQEVPPQPIDPDPVTGLATVNNDGGVIEARYSTDGGETVHRGNAINTRGFVLSDGLVYNAAPNPVQFNFTGGVAGSDGKAYVMANDRVSTEVQAALAGYSSWGYVNGDIMLTYDDNASVTDGVTILDGQFNSDGQNVGDLTIDTDGKLVLVQPDLEGDAQAGGYVDDFTVGSSGSLVYELTTSDAPGDYASIDANTASLDGRIVAVYNAGLYGNNMYYDNVIDADTRTGEFTDVEDNSLLLVTQAVYDDENNVDLAVRRTAFNEVDGLTKNQKAVGGGIEKVYPKINENTDFGRMVASLFTLGDGDYQDFLDQLSGAEYANHLASVLWSTRAIDRIITDRMECTPDSAYQRAADNSSVRVDGSTVTPTADVITSTGCFRPGEANIWMSGTGQWNELSGDRNAPGFDETQYGIFFGADYAFTETLFAGIAGGYFDSQGDFDKWGGRSGSTIDYDGLQLAAYGGYDNATYYLRGIVAYGNYDGDSHRQIKFPGSAEIDPSGSPSSDTWSFYGETGYRFGVMTAGQITPFLGLSLASANLDGFTEKDPQGTGAALKIHDSDASSVATVLGARFTGDWAMASGVFSPVLSVAWMHEFGDTAQEVNMSFAGAPKGANFKVVGSEVARDSAVVDAGAKFIVSDSFDLGLFYNGQFNADYTSNGVTATLGYRF